MRQMLEAHPELQEIRENPAVLQRMMQAAQSPTMMRSMLQQQDSAIRNLLAQPGGASALKRMGKQVRSSAFVDPGMVSRALLPLPAVIVNAIRRQARQKAAAAHAEALQKASQLTPDERLVAEQCPPARRPARRPARPRGCTRVPEG